MKSLLNADYPKVWPFPTKVWPPLCEEGCDSKSGTKALPRGRNQPAASCPNRLERALNKSIQTKETVSICRIIQAVEALLCHH